MIDSAVRERSDALVTTLLDSVRIASVSMTGEGIAEQVGFLRKRLEGWGFAVEVHPTTSHPIIYAETGPRDAKFTWLLYGHYNVYPPTRSRKAGARNPSSRWSRAIAYGGAAPATTRASTSRC